MWQLLILVYIDILACWVGMIYGYGILRCDTQLESTERASNSGVVVKFLYKMYIIRWQIYEDYLFAIT